MSAVAQALEEGEAAAQQCGGAGSSYTSAASASHSISFGSGGCGGTSDAAGQNEAQSWGLAAAPQPPAGAVRPPRRIAGLEGTARLAALARLLEEVQGQGRQVTLPELREAGYSTHDLAALRAWLAQQGA